MEKELLIFLLQKYMAGTLTEAEKTELSVYISRKQNKEITTSVIEELLFQHSGTRELDDRRSNLLINGILNADIIAEDEVKTADSGAAKSKGEKSSRKKLVWSIVALLVVAAASGYMYYFKPFVSVPIGKNIKPVVNDAAPGGNKAVLTISDGSTFVLDSLASGFVTQQGNVKVIKAPNGELMYKPSSEMNQAILYNTVTTPRGGQYQIMLSDGSRVKLNSFSSITYPVSFTGKERSVMITGEAYFEIAQDTRMPFKVMAYDMEVEAQGTQFNVNAYIDEPVLKTTLLKGSLRLSKNSAKHVLQPMQQGQFDKEGNFTLEKNIDPNVVTAWRNGLFEFNNTDLKAVLRQFSRWYDVDIIFETGAPVDQEIVGEVRRNVTLSEAIKLLEKNNIRSKIDGKTLIVMP